MTVRIVAPLPFPLGIADPESGLAFISLYDHVEAIRLGDGTTAWEAAGLYLPLAATNHRVLVHVPDEDPNVIALTILDARTGSFAAHCAPIILPEWVDIHSDDFTEQAAIIDNDFLVWWHAVKRYRGGAPLATLPSPTIAEGARRISSTTGRAMTVAPPRLTPIVAGEYIDVQYDLLDDTLVATAGDGTRRWARRFTRTRTPPRMRP